MSWSLAGSSPSCPARPSRAATICLVSRPLLQPIGYVADSEATTIAALKDDYNALLAALRSCGLMVTGK